MIFDRRYERRREGPVANCLPIAHTVWQLSRLKSVMPNRPNDKLSGARAERGVLAKTYFRRGPRHQAQADVSFLDIRRRFDFRSIQIGRWVTEAEKNRAAGLFYDALCDLMTILGGPEPLISLRGSLALQYGTGGQLGVAAHYVPATHTFALAKNAGPGSIAHEWFHAFDHYICAKAFRGVGSAGSGSNCFGSKAWLNDAPILVHPLNELLRKCYQAVLVDATGNAPSELFRQSAAQDKRLGVVYYSLPEELTARAFEAFVQDASIKNGFLVTGTKQSEEAQLGLYPQGGQRERINAAFRQYFTLLGQALAQSAADAKVGESQ